MPWTPDQPLVRLADVHKTFRQLEVLKGVSMDVIKGEVICIIGPSGSGKSTLLRCVNALVPIERGSILVEGQEVNDPKLDKLALRRKVGMVFQQYNLFPHKTALENVMMAPVHVLKRDRKEVEAQALALIWLPLLRGQLGCLLGALLGTEQHRIEGHAQPGERGAGDPRLALAARREPSLCVGARSVRLCLGVPQ